MLPQAGSHPRGPWGLGSVWDSAAAESEFLCCPESEQVSERERSPGCAWLPGGHFPPERTDWQRVCPSGGGPARLLTPTSWFSPQNGSHRQALGGGGGGGPSVSVQVQNCGALSSQRLFRACVVCCCHEALSSQPLRPLAARLEVQRGQEPGAIAGPPPQACSGLSAAEWEAWILERLRLHCPSAVCLFALSVPGCVPSVVCFSPRGFNCWCSHSSNGEALGAATCA